MATATTPARRRQTGKRVVRAAPAATEPAKTEARTGSRASTATVKGHLFDGTGRDRTVTVTSAGLEKLGKRHTLWVDLSGEKTELIDRVIELFELRPEAAQTLREPAGPPRVALYGSYLLVVVNGVEAVDAGEDTVPLVMIAGPNFVITAHERPVACLTAFQEHLRGDTSIGLFDGPAFLAALLDWHLTLYFQVIDGLEHEADKLDHRALHPKSEGDLLTQLVRLRRRISGVRRSLTPQREVFAALTRPELAGLGDPEDTVHFRALADRLERTIDAVEVARELVLGSFDVHMTRTAQRTNEVMKLLTLATVILLPGSVIAGIMGMNFKVGLFDDPTFFWIVIGGMVAIAIGTLTVARVKRWI